MDNIVFLWDNNVYNDVDTVVSTVGGELMKDVVTTKYKSYTMYRNNDEIYIYHKGILLAFSNQVTEKYHQIYLTGHYGKRTRIAIATLLAYTFDGIIQQEIDDYIVGSYLYKKFNYKGGYGKCFINKYQ